MTHRAKLASLCPGRRDESGLGKIQVYLIMVLVAGALLGIGIYFGSEVTEDREALEEQLNDRYVEKVELSTRNTAGKATIVKIDGKVRPDCKATDDGNLECEHDPQPTLERSAE